MLHQSAVE